jgi:hypothetical protein
MLSIYFAATYTVCADILSWTLQLAWTTPLAESARCFVNITRMMSRAARIYSAIHTHLLEYIEFAMSTHTKPFVLYFSVTPNGHQASVLLEELKAIYPFVDYE